MKPRETRLCAWHLATVLGPLHAGGWRDMERAATPEPGPFISHLACPTTAAIPNTSGRRWGDIDPWNSGRFTLGPWLGPGWA